MLHHEMRVWRMQTQLKSIMMALIVVASLTFAGCGGTALITYTLIYDGNENTGGSVPVDSTRYAEGDTVTVRGNTGELVRTGFYFRTWNTQADGEGTDYVGGDTFTMGTSNATLYAQWGVVYEIGDTGPAGGLIFYDKGSYSDGWRYLEAAPSDQSAGIMWNNGTDVTTGATATVVGTGQANTDAIVAAQGTGNYAAQLCNDLELGGFDDWFLPSRDELDAMYTNLAAGGLGGFAAAAYWSSTETLIDFADAQFMNSGSANDATKATLFRVRAIRAY